jgi:transcription antitermination protein NusB
MGARRKAREFALQALYLVDLTNLTAEKAIRGVIKDAKIDDKTKEFIEYLTQGTLQHLRQLNDVIVDNARNWEMKRMATLDRNILRMGAYEIIYELDTPVSVIIDEAVELAKTFSTEESGKFVNGILDKLKTLRIENHAEEGHKRSKRD